MPTSPQEVRSMMDVIERYMAPAKAEQCFTELHDKVGSKSDNLSFKLSTLMLKTMHTRDGRSLEEKMADLDTLFKSYYAPEVTAAIPQPAFTDLSWHKKLALGFVIGFHFFWIVCVLVSVTTVSFHVPWPAAVLLMTYGMNLVFAPTGCVLTRIEDCLRRRFGLPEVKKFVQHYIFNRWGSRYEVRQ